MVLILTEAGEGIGFGHLTRMIALGEALLARDQRVELFVQWTGAASQSVLEGRQWVVSREWRSLGACELLQQDVEHVVIDSYLFELSGFESLLGQAARVFAVDDFYRLPYPCDGVINPNVFADSVRYLASARAAIGGGQYVILRAAFRCHAGGFQVRDRLERVLVTLGGCDVHGVGAGIVGALATLGCEVVWVAPGGTPPPDETERVRVIGHQSAAGLIEEILCSDVVISGGGQTLHELACLGAPCVAVELGEDQQLNLEYYERVGLLGRRLLWSQPDLCASVVSRIETLRPASVRVELSRKARSQIDGNGVDRVAAHLLREDRTHG
jgi:UDP-2,4-diacetamido-2,4,6-trideoxy-beta-L-altropyranose hydrolase